MIKLRRNHTTNRVVIILPPNTCAEGVGQCLNGSRGVHRLNFDHLPISDSQNVHRGLYLASQRFGEFAKAVRRLPEADVYLWLSSLGGGRGGGRGVKFLEVLSEDVPSRCTIFGLFVLPERFTMVGNLERDRGAVQTTVNTTVSLSRLSALKRGNLSMNFISNKTLRKLFIGDGIRGYDLINHALGHLVVALKEAAESSINLDEAVQRSGRFGTMGMAVEPLPVPIYVDDLPPRMKQAASKCQPWISPGDVPLTVLEKQFVAVGVPRRVRGELKRRPLVGDATMEPPAGEDDAIPVVYRLMAGGEPATAAPAQPERQEETLFATSRHDILAITRYTLGNKTTVKYLEDCRTLEQRWRDSLNPDDPYTKMYQELFERRYGL